eukprot:32784-Amphidinium_carterae.1
MTTVTANSNCAITMDNPPNPRSTDYTQVATIKGSSLRVVALVQEPLLRLNHWVNHRQLAM